MLKTPMINAAFKNEAEELVKDGEKRLEENWINREVKYCKNCKGKAIDPEDLTHCIGCDGTGVDMVVEYGVEDGKFFSRLTQNGLQPLLDLCREYREIEKNKSFMKRAAQPTTRAYLLPESVRLELEFTYPDFKNWESEDMRRAIRIVQKHYPQFMCTHLVI